MINTNTQDTVLYILTNNIEARGDDFILIAEVYDLIRPELRGVPMDYALRHHKDYKLPSFSSIVRARRKLQVMYPDLEPEDSIKKLREDEELKYREYARG